MTKPLTFASLAAAATLAASFAISAQAAEPRVIEMTQTGCQFLEAEQGTDQGFKTDSKADCQRINQEGGEARLAAAQVLELKPGRYIFRVSNRDVPYELGFWLRGAGLGRLTLPSVSGGGLTTGVAKDYEINLKPGDYLYSCPLNPTPDYRIVVKG